MMLYNHHKAVGRQSGLPFQTTIAKKKRTRGIEPIFCTATERRAFEGKMQRGVLGHHKSGGAEDSLNADSQWSKKWL